MQEYIAKRYITFKLYDNSIYTVHFDNIELFRKLKSSLAPYDWDFFICGHLVTEDTYNRVRMFLDDTVVNFA